MRKQLLNTQRNDWLSHRFNSGIEAGAAGEASPTTRAALSVLTLAEVDLAVVLGATPGLSPLGRMRDWMAASDWSGVTGARMARLTPGICSSAGLALSGAAVLRRSALFGLAVAEDGKGKPPQEGQSEGGESGS